MTTKELINKTFDEVIERLKNQKDEMIEIRFSGKQKGMSVGAMQGRHCESQVWDEALDLTTDKNISEICKEGLK